MAVQNFATKKQEETPKFVAKSVLEHKPARQQQEDVARLAAI